MKSILQEDTDYCFVCGRYGTEIHHVVYGKGNNRKLSERFGMTVGLCYYHHRGNNGVHFNRELDMELKRYAQQKFMDAYPEANFLAIFGRNYFYD